MKLVNIVRGVALTVIITPRTVLAAFPDIQANWYKQSIELLEQEGVIQGYEDGFFKPYQTISRAEFLKIALSVAPRINSAPIANCFADVPEGEWFSDFVCQAKQRGITTGKGDGLFHPHDPVTVHEGLAFALRSQNITIPSALEPTWFSGLEQIADKYGIMPTANYNSTTELNRGLATQLIDATRRYGKTKQTNAYQFSAGCKNPTPQSMPKTILVGTANRSYILDVPKNFDATKNYGLLFGFHGRTNTNQQVRGYTRLHSNQTDFITVYPQAIILENGTHNWADAKNIEFMDRLLDALSTHYCIDRTKVFAAGHSLGGWFTHKISCIRGGVFRGMAAVGTGGYSGACNGPSATLLLHNPDDWAVAYSGGQNAFTIRKKRNECSTEEFDSDLSGLDCVQASSCRKGNQTNFCTYTEAPYGSTHGWPRSATPAIHKFFKSNF